MVVCEGYTDVIGFNRAGIERAVATCGTALTEDHVKLIRRFADRLVLAYDADEAGQERPIVSMGGRRPTTSRWR